MSMPASPQCEMYALLRSLLPSFPYEGRLSKIETLRLSISYILLLRDLLVSEQEPQEFIEQHCSNSSNNRGKMLWQTSDLTNRRHWIDWTRLGVTHQHRELGNYQTQQQHQYQYQYQHQYQ